LVCHVNHKGRAVVEVDVDAGGHGLKQGAEFREAHKKKVYGDTLPGGY